jgi:hypothetical protein
MINYYFKPFICLKVIKECLINVIQFETFTNVFKLFIIKRDNLRNLNLLLIVQITRKKELMYLLYKRTKSQRH